MTTIGRGAVGNQYILNVRFQENENPLRITHFGGIPAFPTGSRMVNADPKVPSPSPPRCIALNVLRLSFDPLVLFPIEQGKDRLHAKTTCIALVGIVLRA